MIRILLTGSNGAMGRVIAGLVAKRDDMVILAGVDQTASEDGAFPVYTDPADCPQLPDLLLDFSHPSLFSKVISYVKANHLPAVIATTGLSAAQKEEIAEASALCPIFFSATMSVGVTLLASLARQAAAVLGQEFDIEIIEKHHNRKVDAPSGTALLLADSLSQALCDPPHYVYDRHSVRTKRSKDEIGIHSIRGGNIIGEHEILFAGQNETVTLSHSASSRDLFADGALKAVAFTVGQKPGLYNMEHLVAQLQEDPCHE